jgi:hypothetical protein
MSGRAAQRLAVVVVAGAVVLWLAHGLRALSLDAQGRDRAPAAGGHPSPAQVFDAVSLFTRAARLNADPTPRIDQATLLLRLGRARQAAAVLEGVVRANPGNVRAWTLVAAATAQFDPERSAKASRTLRGLFGQPPGFVSQVEPILTTSGQVLQILPEAVQGQGEASPVVGTNVRFSGWAGSVRDRRPASSILVFSNGRLVAAGRPTLLRPDVARAQGAGLARSGFMILVPLRRLQEGGRKARVQVYVTEQRVASPLQFACDRRQDFMCTG